MSVHEELEKIKEKTVYQGQELKTLIEQSSQVF